jgi:ATP-dependent DNA helicase RecG
MATKSRKTDSRTMMELAIEVMERSIKEYRPDAKASPLVGAVVVFPDGTTDTAFRGELREGDHAEFTLLERKNRHRALDGAVLYATLEPCAPGSRNRPKLGCAERIVLARIKQVYIGIADPDPKVDRKGIQYLLDNGVTVTMFDRDLQQHIHEVNKDFIAQAEQRAQEVKDVHSKEVVLSPLETPMRAANDKDLSPSALKQYRSKLTTKGRMDKDTFDRMLVHQGVLVEGNGAFVPTGFGALLFGSNPRTLMPQAGLLGTIRFPDGKEETRDFDGPFGRGPEQVEQWLRDKLPNVLNRGKMRASREEALPFELVREAVVNALVHRDYGINGAKCQLIVDADKVVVKSPGAPVEPITLEKLQAFDAPMLSRNPVLHYVFNKLGLAEERGMGLRSLKDRSQEQGMPLPAYRWNDPYLELTLYRHATSAAKDVAKSAVVKLSNNELIGLEWMSTKEAFNATEYAISARIPSRTALRHLSNLVELGLLERLGVGRSTRYRLRR